MIIILCDVLTLCFTVNLYEKKGERMFWCFDISCRKLSMFECVHKKS